MKRPRLALDASATLRSVLWWALVALLLFLGWATLRVLSPAPPRSLTFSTGAVDGAYHHFGLRYQALLREHGVQLELLPSSGSIENLRRLRSGVAAAGFVQGGLGTLTLDGAATASALDVQALATVAYEPVWIFSRQLDLSNGLQPLAGKRVAIGLPDSGNAKVARELLHAFELTDTQHKPLRGTVLVEEGGMVAAHKLLAEELDAVFLIAAAQAPAVGHLLRDPKVALTSLDQVEGLSRRFPYFQPVVLKAGSVNPALQLPHSDVHLLATTANLVIGPDVHPALAYLLLEAAHQTHRAPTLLNRTGDFPSPTGTDFPLAEEGERYFKNGRPFLQRYLPFWMANFVQRLILLLIPFAALVVPAFTLVVWLLGMRHRRKMLYFYDSLKSIDNELMQALASGESVEGARQRLDQLAQGIDATRFPASDADRLFALRQHVSLLRIKLPARPAP